MEIKPFLVEEWMNQYEVGARYNLSLIHISEPTRRS